MSSSIRFGYPSEIKLKENCKTKHDRLLLTNQKQEKLATASNKCCYGWSS